MHFNRFSMITVKILHLGDQKQEKSIPFSHLLFVGGLCVMFSLVEREKSFISHGHISTNKVLGLNWIHNIYNEVVIRKTQQL